MVLLILAYYLGICCCLFVPGFYIETNPRFTATDSVKLEKNNHPEEVAQCDADVVRFSASSKSVQVPLDSNTTILYRTHSSIFHAIYKLTADVLCPISKEGVKR